MPGDCIGHRCSRKNAAPDVATLHLGHPKLPGATFVMAIEAPRLPHPCGGGQAVGLGQLQFANYHLGPKADLPESWVLHGLHDNGLGCIFPCPFVIKTQKQGGAGDIPFAPIILISAFSTSSTQLLPTSVNPHQRGPSRATISQTGNPSMGSTRPACYRKKGSPTSALQLSVGHEPQQTQALRPGLASPFPVWASTFPSEG